ncbi:hypothetical protein LTR56_008198 [Elasticomyces elasticus]|nr:hypothetical protein LTR56_008198 [Elasticomyces elasticus]KAK3661763.1 hypothetical protein LTR22_007344 [Elasticomyces elasticus]KAK4924368.1 hypothetical protein LTR49_008457 [Elasticomyces elasticus]KAK5762668.1 hypothetical protein LTS12_007260 [Elasticomyces elasticus]
MRIRHDRAGYRLTAPKAQQTVWQAATFVVSRKSKMTTALRASAQWSTMLSIMSEKTVALLPGRGARLSACTIKGMHMLYDSKVETEEMTLARDKLLIWDSSQFSNDVKSLLRQQGSGSRGTVEQGEITDAVVEVREAIEEVRADGHIHASYGTKKSALNTLREIGIELVFPRTLLAHEVAQRFRNDGQITSLMLAILRSMSAEDIIRLARTTSNSGTFLGKTKELVKVARDRGMLLGIGRVVEILMHGSSSGLV